MQRLFRLHPRLSSRSLYLSVLLPIKTTLVYHATQVPFRLLVQNIIASSNELLVSSSLIILVGSPSNPSPARSTFCLTRSPLSHSFQGECKLRSSSRRVLNFKYLLLLFTCIIALAIPCARGSSSPLGFSPSKSTHEVLILRRSSNFSL